jgi:hypothetical protein
MLSFVRLFIFSAFFVSFGLAVNAQAQNQTVVPDPAVFSLEILTVLEKEGATVAAEKIGSALANPNAKATLAGTLGLFEKKPPKILKIASDKDYAGVIRVLTLYAFGLNDQHPFLYFQMTYKMTDKGWVLTGFNFRTEGQHAFPSDMVSNVK